MFRGDLVGVDGLARLDPLRQLLEQLDQEGVERGGVGTQIMRVGGMIALRVAGRVACLSPLLL
jgi:hypothetical protein